MKSTSQQRIRRKRTLRIAKMKAASKILKPLRKTMTLQEIADLIGDDTQPISVSDYINCNRPPSDVRFAILSAPGFGKNGKAKR